jgi:hypothetical protein
MLPAKTAPVRSTFPALDDWFNYVFTYFPVTNWQHAFSPTIYFGSNVQDIPEEQHVLYQVGSYGYQLNRIIDMLKVVVDHGKFNGKKNGSKSGRDQQVIQKFLELAKATDTAASDFKGEATEQSVQEVIACLRRLQHSDDERYKTLVGQLQRAFPK